MTEAEVKEFLCNHLKIDIEVDHHSEMGIDKTHRVGINLYLDDELIDSDYILLHY
jgi:hypothetical protein